ncbi:lymphatic vessel endothelial hyaluronic receptor 1b, partial [Notolabrus celidotus]|uniref:lymphatic vessel endothelial hyaluronic receptor 1b n=1 Tax=Notolabrus celidotus TaxID=1203425 RepID=UPI0014901C1D
FLWGRFPKLCCIEAGSVGCCAVLEDQSIAIHSEAAKRQCYFSSASDSDLMKAVHQSHRAAGVFLLIEGGVYTFNFTAARDACLFLNTTIATRDQMERALQHGLETCKFGWIAEQVAVVPRLTADEKCGQGKTGVVRWAASTDKTFGVFCFNASDLAEALNRSTSSPQSFTSFTTQTAGTQTSSPLTTKALPSGPLQTTKASEPTSFTSALQVKTSRPSTTPSAQEPPSSSSHLITSEPTDVRGAFTTSAHALFTSESETRPPVISGKPSLGDVPTALIILGVIVLLLTAAGFVWYFKPNIFTFWAQAQQKEDMETEMWKHTDSEMDLHSQHDGGEEESDRKYSSDITLCVNPDIKVNSSE